MSVPQHRKFGDNREWKQKGRRGRGRGGGYVGKYRRRREDPPSSNLDSTGMEELSDYLKRIKLEICKTKLDKNGFGVLIHSITSRLLEELPGKVSQDGVDVMWLQLFDIISTVYTSHAVFFSPQHLEVILGCLLYFIAAPSPNSTPPNSGLSAAQLLLSALRSLSFVLLNNGSRSSKGPEAVQYLLPYLSHSDVEIQRLCTTCLGNAFLKTSQPVGASRNSFAQSFKPLYQTAFNRIFINVTKYSKAVEADLRLVKVLAVSLRALAIITSEGKNVHVSHFSSFILILKKLLLFGYERRKGDFFSEGDEVLLSEKMKEEAKKKPKKNEKHRERKVFGKSDYDYSDAEHSDMDFDRFDSWKVRFHALSCIESLAKVSNVKFHQFWPQFFPSPTALLASRMGTDVPRTVDGLYELWVAYNHLDPKSDYLTRGLLCGMMLKDPVHQVRGAVAKTISAMLKSSKLYLQHANDGIMEPVSTSPKLAKREGTKIVSMRSSSVSPILPKIAFAPRSLVVGAMLRELHYCLLSDIRREHRPGARMQALRCLSTLIKSCTYRHLSPGFLSLVSDHLIPLILFEEPEVFTCEAVDCLSTVFSLPMKEVRNYVMQYHPPSNCPMEIASDDNVPPLLSMLITRCCNGDISNEKELLLDSRISMLCLFSSLVVAHFSLFQKIASKLLLSLKQLLQTRTPSDKLSTPRIFRVEAVNLLCEITKNAATRDGYNTRPPSGGGENTAKITNPRGAGGKGETVFKNFSLTLPIEKLNSETPLKLTRCEFVWKILLDTGFQMCFSDYYKPVRISSCELFAQLPAPVFDSLETTKQYMIVTMILGLASRDEAASVRAAACRALGIYILFTSLRADPNFFTDTCITVCEAVNDPVLSVRIRACWALANLCDALILIRESETPDDIPRSILTQVVHCALKAAIDNDKVRANAVRALGNFTHFIPSADLLDNEGGIRDLCDQVLNVLAQNLSDRKRVVKVRWNAAYAIGNLFKNSRLPLRRNQAVATAITTLMRIVTAEKNFKVRINAALALCCPQKYGYYQGLFWEVLSICIDALLQLDSTVDKGDYETILRSTNNKTTSSVVGISPPNVEDSKEADYIEALSLQLLKLIDHLLCICYDELFDGKKPPVSSADSYLNLSLASLSSSLADTQGCISSQGTTSDDKTSHLSVTSFSTSPISPQKTASSGSKTQNHNLAKLLDTISPHLPTLENFARKIIAVRGFSLPSTDIKEDHQEQLLDGVSQFRLLLKVIVLSQSVD